VLNSLIARKNIRISGGIVVLAGIFCLILSPFIGRVAFDALWGVEPLAYIGVALLVAGLGVISLSYFVGGLGRQTGRQNGAAGETEHWGEVIRRYFELFDHDLARPLRQILGKERELAAVLRASGTEVAQPVQELLDEIERQVPSFRLMMSNIQVLTWLEAPNSTPRVQALEPAEIVRKIADRYTSLCAKFQKEITWWAEPAEFGLVYSDGTAVEHIVTNLVDNAVRFAGTHIEIKLTRNPDHFFIRVWDDGSGIPEQYLPHIFDRAWTPEAARGEQKSSSGLGLFIARALAKQYGGELTVSSLAEPAPEHGTAFLLSMPLGQPA
jgi:K+-sensing histidine kinase KdpD